MAKSCYRCGEKQNIEEFGVIDVKYNQSGRRGLCNSCRRAEDAKRAPAHRTKMNALYANDIEFRKRSQNRARRYYENNTEKRRVSSRQSVLKYRYGITVKEFEQKAKAQNYRCIICGRTAEDADPRRKHLCQDHDHTTGRNRDLLCSQCNTLLGHAQDSVCILQRAAAYLTRHAEHDRLTTVAPLTDAFTDLLPRAPEVPTTAPGLVN
jgi:Recombination endonuclease VII